MPFEQLEQLAMLLLRIFSNDELRHIARRHPKAQALLARLPEPYSMPRIEYVRVYVDVLFQQQALDQAFFDRLVAEAPRRCAELRKAQRLFQRIIVVILSNPPGVPSLSLNRERSAIEDALKTSLAAHHAWALYVLRQLTPEDLLRLMDTSQPDVLHFAGHSRPDSLVGADKERDSYLLLGTKTLEQTLGALDTPPVLVFNSCQSAEIAKTLAAYGGCAVGTSAPLHDEVGLKFASGFYLRLIATQDPVRAFEGGKINVAAYGMPDAETFHLFGDTHFQFRRVAGEEETVESPPPPALF